MKRIIALTLAVLMCLTMLTGCGGTGLKIDGQNIPMGYYGYFFGSTYAQVQDSEAVTVTAMETLKQFIAVKDLAKRERVELEPLERKEIIDEVNAEAQSMGKSTWTYVLDLLDLTESQYLDIQYTYKLMEKLQKHFFDQETGVTPMTDEDFIARYRDDFVHSRHILISTQTAQSDADYGKALKLANEAYARAIAGEDFAELMHEYSEDPGQTDDGYYFTEGQMVQPFEDTSFALEENAISEPIQSSYGYHIIQRLPMDDEYILSQKGVYLSYYMSIAFAEYVDTITADMVVEVSDDFYNYDLTGPVTAFMGEG